MHSEMIIHSVITTITLKRRPFLGNIGHHRYAMCLIELQRLTHQDQ